MKLEIPHTLPEHKPYVIKVRKLGTEYLVNKILGVVAHRVSQRKWWVTIQIPGHDSTRARVVR